MTATEAIERKRRQLTRFIERALAPEPAVQAVIAVGSVAMGQARPDSDIDAVVFLDPFDPYVVPAEFLWRPSDNTFHSIFSREPGLEGEAFALDLARFDLRQWMDPRFTCPEGRRAELALGWTAFDRTGVVTRLLAERTRYPEGLRRARLDEAITWLDQHLGGNGPEVRWQSLGPLLAHDRLHAAYDYLAHALFACNRRWRPWRNREMSYLLALPWLPDDFEARILSALNAPAHDHAGYAARVEALRGLFADVLARLVADGDYPEEDPISAAFIRSHDEPGRAWNMDAWNRQRGLA